MTTDDLQTRINSLEASLKKLQLEMEDGHEIIEDLVRAIEQLTEKQKGLNGEWWRPGLATARVWLVRNKRQ